MEELSISVIACIIILVLFVALGAYVYFFFASRRRHTGSGCDWSSDVCSSDLRVGIWPEITVIELHSNQV